MRGDWRPTEPRYEAKLPMRSGTRSVSGSDPLELDAYQAFAAATNRSQQGGEDRLGFLLLGLFGEVGSLLSELKKKQRDQNAYFAYAHSTYEETGDVLWYFANVAHELGFSLAELAGAASAGSLDGRRVERFLDLQQQVSLFEEPASTPHVQRSLLKLAARAGRLVRRANAPSEAQPEELRLDLVHILEALVAAASDAHINLERAARDNVVKILDRWPIERRHTPLFDDEYDADEQLPRHLEVTFNEKEIRGVKYVFQSVHGLHLGDRLTDNSTDADDYRFHDVFHLAYAAVLGWSPVLRALLRLKRKSNKAVDEQEDGARAVITEEGISNWVFAHGLRHQAFEGVDGLDFALLRTIRQMVRGYEVQTCPSWMWEEAILQGFAAFRSLREHRGGRVIADLHTRTLTYVR